MAPIPSPDLDLARCFKGEQQLVTWNVVYKALCDPETASKSEALRSFLTADQNIDILSRPWKPFPDASPQEKSKLESKTAPISVTPGQAGHYDLEEIKRDSMWLSAQAQISEYAALQLVVEEWQYRPTTQLLNGLTEEEALSVQEAAGITNLGASTFMPNSSILSTPLASKNSAVDTEHQRRLRIIETYHTSCASILRVSQMLVSWGSASYLRSQTIYGNDYAVLGAAWIEELGQEIAARQSGRSKSATSAKALEQCLQALQKRCDNLATYEWEVDESIVELASEKWVVAQTVELLHILHLALIHADLVTTGFVPAATIEDWLQTFSNQGFFRDFTAVTPRQEPLVPIIQLLTSLVSLSLLKADSIIGDLTSDYYKNWDTSTYLLNTVVLKNITVMFAAATELGSSPATPAIFAWAIITEVLRNIAARDEQAREGLLDSPRRSANAPTGPSPLEEAALVLSNPDHEIADIFGDNVPSRTLANAGAEMGVLQIINQFVEIGLPAFGTLVDEITRDRIRILFLQLIRVFIDTDFYAYSPESIITTYTILCGPNTFRTWADADAVDHSDPAVSFFLEDEYVLRPFLLNETRLRYPYEITPFLKFCSALVRGDKNIQNGMPTFVDKLTTANRLMQQLPNGFRDFTLAREEENNNWVELTADLPLFASPKSTGFGSHRRLLTNGPSSPAHDLMTIPAGTEGIIVDPETQPYVVVWHHQHSTLSYLCQLLSTYPTSGGKVEYNTESRASCESVAEIIGLFADLLHSSLHASQGVCSAELLEVLDINTEGGSDSANIILSIFEQELLHLCQQPNDETSLELLVNCTHFLEAFIIIAPNRVWPWLARSGLLEGDGNGSLAKILIGTEMVLGRYDFLIGCIRMYKALVKDAVERSVSRKSPSKALSRFNSSVSSDSGTSDKVMSTILFTFGRTLASIYESSLNWKYSNAEHRVEINVAICSVFTTILKLAYGVDDSPKLAAKLTRSIAPIAEYLTQLYLTKLGDSLPMNPILASLVVGVGSENETLLTSPSALWRQQTESTLEFADTSVRVAILLDRPWTHLEQQLFKATPLLARLYATSDKWKTPVVVLLETLVRGAVRVTRTNCDDATDNAQEHTQSDQREPPSLLGHLGPVTARNFLSVLSLLDEPLRLVDIQTNVWNLLSAVVTCKQQWFSLYLLTGSTPRDSVRNAAASSPGPRSKALLSRALDALSSFDFESNNVAWPLYTSMLEFVSSAQNNWSWAMSNTSERKVLVRRLLVFLKWMTKQIRTLRTDTETLDRSYQNKFAALACEVVAMHLHSSRQAGDITVLKEVVPSLEYLQECALVLPAYNASVHSYLKSNLERQYPGVLLANLKRTTLHPERYGRAFFYDVELGQKLLGYDSKWAGPREGTGFASDFEKANINLGLVDSQISLLHGWKLLSLELSSVVAKDERLVKVIIGVVKQCMIANSEASLPEALFGRLMLVRADLAFTLLKKLVEAKVQTPAARSLLTPIWNAIRATTPDFESVFSSEGVHYYRTLLRILYLALHFHLVEDSDQSEETSFRSSFRGAVPTSHHEHTEPISTQLLEILADIVAKGFRSLANQLHTDSTSVSPSDFALLTALLQRTIAIPELHKWQNQAALIFSNSNTVRYAVSLFSWSDRLTVSHNTVPDPVYGELSLLFILTLSSIPALAETMAVEGILSQLNTANVMNYYRRPHGMGPFDAPARLHSIWTKGFLPLCLNLLLSVGAPIAAEIASFLNQFPEQLLRASFSLTASPSGRHVRDNSKISLSLASEIHSLAMISAILEQVKRDGPRLGIQANEVASLEWEKDVLREDVESCLGRRGALRERIVATDEKEVEMLARKAVGSGSGGAEEEGSVLEERIVGELEGAGRCFGGRGK